jgi:hypothetical protein
MPGSLVSSCRSRSKQGNGCSGIRDGFTTAARETVPGARRVKIRFFQFVFEETPPERWRLVRIIERGTE